MKKYLPLLLFTIFLASCHSHKEVIYFQDAVFNQEEAIANVNSIKIRPADQLAITVSCKEPAIAQLLNPIEANRRLQPTASSGVVNATTSTQNFVLPYVVDAEGNIDFPLIGKVHVAGLTREEVAQKIKNQIIKDEIVSDPIVFVQFSNLHFSVMGEVMRPGAYAINTETITLLDALSQAGDLTIYGKRDKVLVIREIDGKRTKYVVDLRSQGMFNSPAYYIQQNDLIYVEPNTTRAGQSSINENNWKSVGLWMSLASLLMSAAVLIFK